MKNKLLLAVLLLASLGSAAKQVIVADSIYSKAPSKDLAEFVDSVAGKVGFSGDYELMVPTKARMEVNPWDRFITSAQSPSTNKPIILINQEWFDNRPKEQIEFTVASHLTSFQVGKQTTLMKALPFIAIPFFWLVIFLLFKLIGALGFVPQGRWNRVIKVTLAYALGVLININIISGAILPFITAKLAFGRELYIYELTIKKLGIDKEVAIKALLSSDTAIKQEIKNGEDALEGHENHYENMAKSLAKKS